MISILGILLLCTIVVPSAIAQNTLSLTVATDKPICQLSELVHINGSLMWVPNNIPVADGLIGVEIRNSEALPFVFRTRPTGSFNGENWLVNFTQLYPSDSNGVPKYSFKRGETLWIFAEIKNFDAVLSHFADICLTLYDADSVPIGAWHTAGSSIMPGGVLSSFTQAMTISSSMTLGNATLYGNAYSDFPKNGGYPYCPEKAVTFTVTSTSTPPMSTSSKSAAVVSSDGTYELWFRFGSGAKTGSYTVYASTYYYNTLLTANTTLALHLIADINDDGAVDIFDAILLSTAYASSPGDPNWIPEADLDSSGYIDVFDAIILASHYGEHV